MQDSNLASVQVVSVGKEATLYGVGSDGYFCELLANPGVDIWGHIATFMRVARALGRSATIIDIGANIGLTVLAGSRLAPDGQIIAVEPSPTALQALRRLVGANNLMNVRIVEQCVGATPGTVSFVQNDSFLAGSYVGTDAREEAACDVEMVTLDDLVERIAPASVDMVKIDVEGFEFDVLAGGLATMDKYKPVYVAEFNSFAITANRNGSPRELLDFVIDHFGSFKVVRNEAIQTISSSKEVRDFIYSNMTVYGCVEDIIFGRETEIDLTRS